MGRHNVTQMQLCAVLGVSQTGVSKRLRGLTPFDANEIWLLAQHFDVNPGDLFGVAANGGPGGGGSMATGEYPYSDPYHVAA
jgi:transcriptional regulator with XRE-family HTH domain